MPVMPSRVPYKFVKVTWRDAEADPRWADADDLIEHNAISLKSPNGSYGFLVSDDKHWLVVASTYSWNGSDFTWTSIMRIPKGMVLSITEVKIP